MGNLPEGTVTFLFSDVEGSTRLAKSLGDARWASLLEDHRSLLRRAFAAHGGHEVNTQGTPSSWYSRVPPSMSLDSESGVRGSLDDQLIAALTRSKCLLLIDNCGHLLDAVADLVDRVLCASSSVVVLATSREALGVEGEQVVRVASLGIPEDPSEAARSESVQLFVERATAVKPSCQLDSQTQSPVVEICRRLDGIPLASERHFSPLTGRIRRARKPQDQCIGARH